MHNAILKNDDFLKIEKIQELNFQNFAIYKIEILKDNLSLCMLAWDM